MSTVSIRGGTEVAFLADIEELELAVLGFSSRHQQVNPNRSALTRRPDVLSLISLALIDRGRVETDEAGRRRL
jgi:hypothetical protein